MQTVRSPKSTPALPCVMLAGCPNVGKSTVFNALTGLHRHTGNWSGKTVSADAGIVRDGGRAFRLVDLPGTYALAARSGDEAVARDALLSGKADVCVVVCDAFNLERSLVLALHAALFVPNVILAVNFLDQAAKKGLKLDLAALERLTGMPVAGCAASKGRGIGALRDRIWQAIDGAAEKAEGVGAAGCAGAGCAGEAGCMGKEGCAEKEGCDGAGCAGRLIQTDEGRRAAAKEIAAACVMERGQAFGRADRIADAILTGKWTAFPVAAAVFALLFWITVVGANVPSEALSALLMPLLERGRALCLAAGMPAFAAGLVFDGMLRVTAWVVAVMLPPMAIFFPLFTILEDLGFLPRLAYDFDAAFARCGSSGKQILPMCMGLGCNAAGVVGCRIIDSPREKRLAILTNSFIPCNGRLPILTALISLFLFTGVRHGEAWGALVLSLLLGLGIAATFMTDALLSKTLFRGERSVFLMELPPFRAPKVGSLLVRAFLDRTLFVLGRAVLAAMPAGAVIYLLSFFSVNGVSLLGHMTAFLDPFGRFFGMDGVILTAFLLGIPANEIVIPLMAMAYASGTVLTEVGGASLQALFTANGWTAGTAVCVLLFTVFHFPCATTLLTIRKETGRMREVLLAFILPLLWGLVLTFAARVAFSAGI